MLERRKILNNSFAILVNRLTQSITTFALIAGIARQLGTYELGQYVLASSYYFIFMTLTAQGLKILLIRELSRHPDETSKYLVSGSLLQLLLSLMGYFALALLILIFPYSQDTTNVCLVLGLMLIPFSLWNVTEAIFQSRDQMYFITLTAAPIYVIRVLVAWWEMSSGLGIIAVSLDLVISELLVLVSQWLFLTRTVSPNWRIDWKFIWETFASARTLMLLEGVAMAGSRFQLILLSFLADESVVGIYGGMSQLIQPFQIVSNSLIGATFPSLSRSGESDPEKQKSLIQSIIQNLLIISVPCVIGVYFMGKDLLLFIYKDLSFSSVSTEFFIISFSLIFMSLVQPLSFLLVANDLERVNLREVLVTNISSSLISIVLISKYQLMGAAITTIIGAVIGLSQYVYSTYARLFYLDMKKIFYYPIGFGVLMFIIFETLHLCKIEFLPSLIIASLVYLTLGGLFAFFVLGKQKHFFKGFS